MSSIKHELREQLKAILEELAAELAANGKEDWNEVPYDEDMAPNSIGNYDDCVTDGLNAGWNGGQKYICELVLHIIDRHDAKEADEEL